MKNTVISKHSLYTGILFVCLLLLMFCFGFWGLSLVRKTAPVNRPEVSSTDYLIGILATQKSLVTYDSYEKEEGRIDAVAVSTDYTFAETSENTTYTSYEFEDLEGAAFYNYISPEDESTSTRADESIRASTVYNQSDDVTSITLTGVLYATYKENNVTLFFNPIYETPEGDVYATCGGDGVSSLLGPISFDMTGFYKLEGKERTTDYKMNIMLSVELTTPPESYTFLQFNSSDQLLTSASFSNGEVPKEYAPMEDCAYIVVLSVTASQEGSPRTDYRLIQLDDTTNKKSYISTFSDSDYGFCSVKTTAVNWK